MDKKLSIKVPVAGRYLNLTINRDEPDEEELIRKAAKEVNQMLNKYKGSRLLNNHDDPEEYLSMVCLHFATELNKCRRQNNITPLLGEIKIIEEKLGSFMEKL